MAAGGILLFPRLRAGTFIEARFVRVKRGLGVLFLRLWAGIFVAVLNANWEVSCRLRSPVLETTLVSRTGLFSFKHEDGLGLLRIPLVGYLSLK